ncbi:uncharacterized protein LOC123714825 isoform X1 [Pieris brassicae]|uniref:uncharacterized protein LOC123714825 isoform X1 n=1 Tax=Pieris brassicae TaxID=7116 RepID=UPI001E65E84C|nr:uncharacterized protein LOC123714825 isoform X1 [Pieris brassicae]
MLNYCRVKIINHVLSNPRSQTLLKCWYSSSLDSKYSEAEKHKVLEVINQSDSSTLSKYDVTKGRSKNISQWINTYGPLKNICEVETIDGFTEKHVHKLFESIIHNKVKPEKETNALQQIKGQILNPTLTEATRQAANTILTVYVTVNSVSWALIHKHNYAVADWQYRGIEYPDKRFQLGDILEIAWNITNKLPTADLYVMKAEATSLRASGSDPNNPKVLGVNLQKAQMVSMIVALISTKNQDLFSEVMKKSEKTKTKFKQNVYFLRSSLPFRLYGTLIGNERVASDQTVEMLLQDDKMRSSDNSYVYVPEDLKSSFRSQRDLPKDMMGQCLLFALTFMDLCIYKNKDKIQKLLSKRGE